MLNTTGDGFEDQDGDSRYVQFFPPGLSVFILGALSSELCMSHLLVGFPCLFRIFQLPKREVNVAIKYIPTKIIKWLQYKLYWLGTSLEYLW